MEAVCQRLLLEHLDGAVQKTKHAWLGLPAIHPAGIGLIRYLQGDFRLEHQILSVSALKKKP